MTLQHPVNGGVRPTIGGVTLQAEGQALLDGHGPGGFILEVVELGLTDEDGVGGGRAPFVCGETLVLTWIWERGKSVIRGNGNLGGLILNYKNKPCPGLNRRQIDTNLVLSQIWW